VKLGVFAWTVEADWTNGRIPIDDTLGAMSVCLLKVNDGLEYQTYSPEDSRVWADEVFRPQGIDFHPWGVARGWSHDVAYHEGRLAGQHAAQTNSEYVLDLEPYPEHYWQGIPGTPREFCRGYGETSNGVKLRICPDARNPGINLEEWGAEEIVSLWHPQIYATAYGEPLQSWLWSGVQPIMQVGVPKSSIYPVLGVWLNAPGEPSISADQLEQDILYIARQGYPGAALWRRGLMSSQQVERLLAMDDPFVPVTPEPPPQPHASKVVDRMREIQDLAEEVIALEEAK
jgi:hypothetical protein